MKGVPALKNLFPAMLISIVKAEERPEQIQFFGSKHSPTLVLGN